MTMEEMLNNIYDLSAMELYLILISVSAELASRASDVKIDSFNAGTWPTISD